MAKKKKSKTRRRAVKTEKTTGRRTDGKFARGNKLGKGHSPRLHQYLAVWREAVSEDDVRELLQVVLRMAKKGDLKAAQFFCDRFFGRPRRTPAIAAEPLQTIDLPDLNDPKALVRAANNIIKATGRGDLSPEQAATLAALVELARKTHETNQLADEVRELRELVERM
jgi:hypothetical protein